MNDYLGKESNEAATKSLSILRRIFDTKKQLAFQILHSNINISKFGYQQDRQLNGFLGLDSEDLENKEEDEFQPVEPLGSAETESEVETDSDEEQRELNRRLKEGKSGGKGILLGEESMEANARAVISKEENLDQFDNEDFKGNHFESFENQNNQGQHDNSKDVNPLFKNQEKNGEGSSPVNNEKNEIEVDNEQNANEFALKLSFGNDSFNKNGSGMESDVLKLPQTHKVRAESEKGKFNSSFEVEQKKFGKEIDYLLSSKTLGEKSPKTSTMYQER
jgi:hypothetical protein